MPSSQPNCNGITSYHILPQGLKVVVASSFSQIPFGSFFPKVGMMEAWLAFQLNSSRDPPNAHHVENGPGCPSAFCFNFLWVQFRKSELLQPHKKDPKIQPNSQTNRKLALETDSTASRRNMSFVPMETQKHPSHRLPAPRGKFDSRLVRVRASQIFSSPRRRAAQITTEAQATTILNRTFGYASK